MDVNEVKNKYFSRLTDSDYREFLDWYHTMYNETSETHNEYQRAYLCYLRGEAIGWGAKKFMLKAIVFFLLPIFFGLIHFVTGQWAWLCGGAK